MASSIPRMLLLIIYMVISNLTVLEGGHAATKRPHIVFILADDLGWNDVSFHGSLQIPTPNIDTLASNGIVLNNYYVQPMCSPSRAALLTGRHPIHLGLQHFVLRADQAAGLPLNVKLLPEYLRDLGYTTHAVGKWHLGFYKKEYTPTYRGFDSFLGTWLYGMDYYDHTLHVAYNKPEEEFVWGRALREDMKPADKYLGKYATDIFTDRAIDIIDKHNSSQPLFLYVAHVAVHVGNNYRRHQSPVKKFRQMHHIKDHERRLYAGMVATLDNSIGKVFKVLQNRGMLDDTIFILSTDNGGDCNSGFGGVASNWPLRGDKIALWEGGIRGTGIIWSPLLRKNRRVSNQLMHISDWLPTLYKAAGGEVKDLGNIYGQDLWDALSYNLPSPRTEILHNIDSVENSMSLRSGNYKIVVGTTFGGKLDGWCGAYGRNNDISYVKYERKLQNCDVWRVLKERRSWEEITDKWRFEMTVKCNRNRRQSFSTCQPTVRPCLFDIVNDPCEQLNIAHKQPKIVESMMRRLSEFNSTAVPIVNTTLDPKANPFLHSFLWTTWGDD